MTSRRPGWAHRRHHLPPYVLPVAAAMALFVLILALASLLLTLIRRRRSRSSAAAQAPRRFSYSALRRASSSFSASHKLGQGGFGSVYRADLRPPLAVKLMDSASLSGNREFHNELSLAPLFNASAHVVPLLGFARHSRLRHLLLVYPLMTHRSLQDALLDSRRPELASWRRRFSVALDVAQGLMFLHHSCDPAIIHGDIKPSNILLDADFSGKIADFGLARVKSSDVAIEIPSPEAKIDEQRREEFGGSDDASAIEETESLTTVTTTTFFDAERSPEETSRSETAEKASVSDGNFDSRTPEKGGTSGSVGVKEYVMEWIGKEVKERPKSEWVAPEQRPPALPKAERKKRKRRMEWWSSLDDDRKKQKGRPPRMWWREEFCEELVKKSKKRVAEAGACGDSGDLWWQREEEAECSEKKLKKKRSRRSRSSVEWWVDGVGSEIPKSSGISSTPSMRGTVCYVAPEYGGGGPISEKSDVYSFGVLLLVIVAGRRPLQMSGSPMAEFERANLISWGRHLARRGKLLELVDLTIEGLDREQAMLCVIVALLCLQRCPSKRPSMKEVVGMLSGQSEPPHLPIEFSPSPPSGFPRRSRKKGC